MRPRRGFRVALLAAFLVACAGCARYRIGQCSLYSPDIRTVYVPMFDSTSFRPFMGERLTEAVCKEIELKTPYKVVNTPDADSVLSGRLVNEAKSSLVFAPTAESRYLQYNMRVEVSWLDRKGQQIQQSQGIPIPSSMAYIDQNGAFTPETGQSVSTAEMQDIQRMAQQIVSLMEAPW